MMQAIGVHLAVTFGVMIAAGFVLKSAIPYKYEGVQTFESMKSMSASAKIDQYKELTPIGYSEQQQPRLDVILARKSLRVGYYDAGLPYASRNRDGLVVGFDVELVNQFAKDLDINLSVIRMSNSNRQNEAELLADGSVDIVIGGHTITPKRALEVSFSDPYSFHTLGLLVNDAKRDEFSELYSIKSMKTLNLGMGNNKYYQDIVKEYLPNATITEFKDVRQFLKGTNPDVDAFIHSTEAGSAWAMLYPNYSAVIPKGLRFRAPVAFVMPKSQLDYVQYMNTWLKLKKETGFQERVYDYWILGKNPKAQKPRWSVMKDVLGWL
jgi:ABC-type amino acid transport substrate-binding protein